MAARLNPQQDERTRNAIRTTQLAKRLEMFVLSEDDPTSKKPVEMSAAQVTAALGLLKKTLPDLTSTELTGEVTQRYVVRGPSPVKGTAEWMETYAPPSLETGS